MNNDNDHIARLALTERHIAEGRRRIAVQTERVQKLHEKGVDATSAEQLLRIMEETLENFLELQCLIEKSLRLGTRKPLSIMPT